MIKHVHIWTETVGWTYEYNHNHRGLSGSIQLAASQHYETTAASADFWLAH